MQVYLHGSLGRKWGFKPFEVNAQTPRQATMALCSMLGQKFRQAIRDGQFELTNKRVKKLNVTDIGAEELDFKNRTDEFHYWPVVQGASAVVRIVIGVVLLVIGYFFPVLAPYTTPMAASLILGGVAELLAPKPQLSKPTDQAGQNPSFIFNGTVNVTEQGGPPPVILGRVRRASSVVLSAGLATENLPV